MSDDIDTTEDEELDPSVKLKSSKPWLTLLDRSDKAGFASYQQKCTNIEKLYADLERLASNTRDREMQLFWANLEVLKPSIYSRPPVPVVVPRFKDRKPIPRMASELLERSATVAFEIEDINDVMKQVRDDLATCARGQLWLRYEAKSKDNNFAEKVCIDHKNRHDFKHDPARYWKEVDWVAGGAWLTRAEMRKRFSKTSGKAYKEADYGLQKDEQSQTHDGKMKARVWEIWSKSQNRVVWVSPGVDVVLDEGEPHLTLEGFFPCPRPAYGTTQRNTLIPIPDFLFYRDQLEEINDVTARISSLTEAVRLRGFYPAGAGEISDAVEAAMKATSDNVTLVGVSNWAMLGNGAAKDTIVWLPLDMVVAAIKELIGLRQQQINDVYEVTGLSDIMRGSTNPNETLGAQNLKSQYGSVRVRDRQEELVRIARDAVRIAAEIMAENFQGKTLLEMSQLEIKSDADVRKEIKGFEDQAKSIIVELKEAQSDPEIQEMVKQNPEQAQQIIQQQEQRVQELQGQVAQAQQQVTIEQIMKLLRDQRVRPFVLDIESDSTVQANEDAEKQRRTEFTQALGGVISQLAPMVQTQPESAPFAAAVLKFAVAPFRAGRELEGAIEEFAEKLQQVAGQGKPDPNAGQAEAAAAEAKAKQEEAAAKQQDRQFDQKMKTDEATMKADLAKRESDERMKGIFAKNMAEETESKIRVQAINAKAAADAEEHRQKMELGALQIEKLKVELGKTAAEAVVAPVVSVEEIL